MVLSIIPFWSSIFVWIITIVELKKRKGTTKSWLLFLLILFSATLLVAFINAIVMSGQNPILNFIVAWAIFAISNILCIYLQKELVLSQASANETQKHTCENVQKNKSKKAVVISVSIFGGFFVLMSIIALFIILSHLKGFSKIEDTNGADNYALNTITQEDIVSDRISASILGINHRYEGEPTGVSDTLRKYDYDTVHFAVSQFHGVQTLQATQPVEDDLLLTIDSTVEKGNCAIIIVVDGAYYCDVPLNQSTQLTVCGVKGKTVIVKIAGESAKVAVDVERILYTTADN